MFSKVDLLLNFIAELFHGESQAPWGAGAALRITCFLHGVVMTRHRDQREIGSNTRAWVRDEGLHQGIVGTLLTPAYGVRKV
jgi:hypothetical protein